VVGFCQDEKVLPIYTWRFAMNCLKRRGGLRFVLFSMMIVVFAGVSVVEAGPLWEEVQKFFKESPSETRWFGRSVAISGNLAVIGSMTGDGNVVGSGAAYVIDTTTGQQLFKLTASDGAAEDRFGISVAVSGNLAIVGASEDDDNDFNSGSVYVFDVTTGTQLFKLLAPDGTSSDRFGETVAIDGNRAVVGAPSAMGQESASGAAYMFDVSTGTFLFKLAASDGQYADSFGSAVSISGNTVIVGAFLDDDNGLDSGSAYLFDVTTGQQLFKLVASDRMAGDKFGASVNIRGGLALVGALFSTQSRKKSGAAYLFDVTTGQQLFTFIASDAKKFDRFGDSVAMNDRLALIGAGSGKGNDAGSGTVYVFDLDSHQLLTKLIAVDGIADGHFGSSVAIDGNITMVGAVDPNGLADTPGSAYLFQERTTNYLTVTPVPLRSSRLGTFDFVGGVPNANAWLLYSFDGLGRTIIRSLHVAVDLVNPKIAFGPVLTDENGDGHILRRVPIEDPATQVWFQIVQQGSATNYIQTQIVP